MASERARANSGFWYRIGWLLEPSSIHSDGGSAVRVGLVQVDVLDVGGEARREATVAGGLHRGQDLRGHLEVPGVVGLADLQHRASGRLGVAATLDGHVAEEGLALGDARGSSGSTRR